MTTSVFPAPAPAPATSCPFPCQLQLEDWEHYGDLMELRCLASGNSRDVDIIGTPRLSGDAIDDPDGRWYRNVELDGFRIDRLVWKDKDNGLPTGVTQVTELSPEDRRQWEAEAFALIETDESLRLRVVEKQIGVF